MLGILYKKSISSVTISVVVNVIQSCFLYTNTPLGRVNILLILDSLSNSNTSSMCFWSIKFVSPKIDFIPFLKTLTFIALCNLLKPFIFMSTVSEVTLHISLNLDSASASI